MTGPARTDFEARAHATFTALMWSLSHPGRPQILPATGRDAFLAIAEALVDLETSFFTPDPQLDVQIARTGARRRTADTALYQFFPHLAPADLALLRGAPLGSFRDPDQAATLVVGCGLETGQRLQLRGPGVRDAIEVQVGGLPEEFWALRSTLARYPLGWDCFLVDRGFVLGLPRTTQIALL
jgi:alpha-D-ribose 1-methylphosphonate 5-triphosphate synthase subunit PhnH